MKNPSKLRAPSTLIVVTGAFLLVFTTNAAHGRDVTVRSNDTNSVAVVSIPGHISGRPFAGAATLHEHRHGEMLFTRRDSDHFCGTDFTSESARFAARSYYEARIGGTLPRLAKSLMVPDIGDERTFNVIEGGWIERTFRLLDKTSEYFLWMDLVDIPKLPGFDIAGFRSAMMDSTPTGSIDRNSGVIVNNNNIFGQPPDFDLDGITDILLYNIGLENQSNVAGYVSSADVLLEADPGVGNQADVLYIDPFRNTASIAAVAAHEYVHLLHLSSGWDETFLTEGYAEFGMVLNGFSFWRNIDYLTRTFEIPADEGVEIVKDYELPFFTWRPGGGEFTEDYQRGNHFFTYMAEQFDAPLVGEMLQNNVKGWVGMRDIMGQRGADLDAVLINFHTANRYNNSSVDPAFVHLEPGRTNVKAPITKTINGEVSVLNDEDEPVFQTVQPAKKIRAGSVTYIEWTNVADFSITLDAFGFQGICDADPDGALCESVRTKARGPIRAIFVGIRPDLSQEIRRISARDEAHFFEGRFLSLTAVMAHTDAGIFSAAAGAVNGVTPQLTYTAQWTPLSVVTDTEPALPVPQSFALDQNYPNPFNPRTTIPFRMERTGHAKLSVYDILGREVAVLVDHVLAAGSYTREVDASAWSSGTYFVRFSADGNSATRIMHLIR